VLWHDWWSAPGVAEACTRIDPVWSHAAWSENFPWTRLEGVELPAAAKEPPPRGALEPRAVRDAAGDGSFGGAYSKPDDAMLEIWRIGVGEVRALLESGWS
jgi:creatinine amidohydrolase